MTTNTPPSRRQWSVEIPSTSLPDRGNIHRSIEPESTPKLSFQGCYTLYECLRRGRDVSPLGPCLGFRAVSTSGFATPYVYSSYTECVARVDAFAAGLERLKLVENRNEDGMLLVAIYLKNCVEWVIAEHSCYTLGGSTVPLYDTLGPSSVEFILNQTQAPVVICRRSELAHLCEAKVNGTSTFHHVILVDGVTPEASHLAQNAGLSVTSFAKVEAVGAQLLSSEGYTPKPPKGNDIATFCYTSGTTGNPKGALISHENMMSAMSCTGDTGLMALPSDRHFSYLPLPHIFERMVLSGVLCAGGSVGFFRGDPTLLIEDMVALRPTFLPVAPRVLNKIHDKIVAGITAAGGLKKKIFDAAILAKSNGLRDGHLTHALYDKLLFNKIKTALGMDHIRFMVSGSAPLSSSVMTFFRCMLGVPVIEGYGQTENTAGATLGALDDMASVGHVGGPIGCVEIVLVDIPDMGYLHTDTHHANEPCRGRGEICVRGPCVFKGYYKEPEKTKEAIDEDGWLHSGDVGLWTLDGQLKIIDRKKNIFKLSQGEYVAAEKIENILLQSPFISQCFVYGDSFQSCLVAIIVPDEEVVLKWASDIDPNSLGNESFANLCKRSEQLMGEIMMEIKTLSKKNKLMGFETIRAVHLDAELFSEANGLVTPTFKLKRQQLKDYYLKQIEALYAGMPPPPSKL